MSDQTTGITDASAGGAPAASDGTPPETAGELMGALERAYDMIAVGGPVVLILLAMSVFAVAIILAKSVQFAAIGSGRGVERVVGQVRAGRMREALNGAKRLRGAEKAAVLCAVEGLSVGRQDARVREEARRLGSEALETMGGWLRPLEVIASLAPLLGLFGTVLGMIDAFAELEAAGSRVDPSILSGGIWEALLTTAVGLAVAIPAVVAFNWFERRIERTEHRIENALSALFASDPALETGALPEHRFKPALAGE